MKKNPNTTLFFSLCRTLIQVHCKRHHNILQINTFVLRSPQGLQQPPEQSRKVWWVKIVFLFEHIIKTNSSKIWLWQCREFFYRCVGSALHVYLCSPPSSCKGIETVLSLARNTGLCNFASKSHHKKFAFELLKLSRCTVVGKTRKSHPVFWVFLINWLVPLAKAALWHLANKHVLCCAHISMKIKQQMQTHSQKHKSVNCWNVLQLLGFSKADVKAL